MSYSYAILGYAPVSHTHPTCWQVAFEAVTKSMKERTGQLEARGEAIVGSKEMMEKRGRPWIHNSCHRVHDMYIVYSHTIHIACIDFAVRRCMWRM